MKRVLLEAQVHGAIFISEWYFIFEFSGIISEEGLIRARALMVKIR